MRFDGVSNRRKRMRQKIYKINNTLSVSDRRKNDTQIYFTLDAADAHPRRI